MAIVTSWVFEHAAFIRFPFVDGEADDRDSRERESDGSSRKHYNFRQLDVEIGRLNLTAIHRLVSSTRGKQPPRYDLKAETRPENIFNLAFSVDRTRFASSRASNESRDVRVDALMTRRR